MKVAFFILVLILMGCAKKLSPASYLDFQNENKTDFSLELESKAKYQINYITPEQIIAENFDATKKEEAIVEIKRMKENQISLFKLSISVNTGNLFSQNTAPRSEQMEYYSIEFKKQILAVTKSLDTISCQGYFFEAGGGFGPNSHFEFYFPNEIGEINEIIIYPKYLESKSLNIDLSNLHHEFPELRLK
jgi:hypothetical protein